MSQMLVYLIHRWLYHEAIKERDKKLPMDCRLGLPSEKPEVTDSMQCTQSFFLFKIGISGLY
jgi:hypothetical protein